MSIIGQAGGGELEQHYTGIYYHVERQTWIISRPELIRSLGGDPDRWLDQQAAEHMIANLARGTWDRVEVCR